MDPGQEPRKSNTKVHAFTFYCNHVDKHLPGGWAGYTHDKYQWALWSFQFHFYTHLGLCAWAAHVCSLHVDRVHAEMCLKAASCMHGELRHNVSRACTQVYNVYVCTRCVFLQRGGRRAHHSPLCSCHSALTTVKYPGGKWSRTYFPFFRNQDARTWSSCLTGTLCACGV